MARCNYDLKKICKISIKNEFIQFYWYERFDSLLGVKLWIWFRCIERWISTNDLQNLIIRWHLIIWLDQFCVILDFNLLFCDNHFILHFWNNQALSSGNKMKVWNCSAQFPIVGLLWYCTFALPTNCCFFAPPTSH